jgi:hypothetical protein
VFVLDFGFSSLFSELPGVDPEFHKKCRMLLVVDLRRQFVERLLNVLQLMPCFCSSSRTNCLSI